MPYWRIFKENQNLLWFLKNIHKIRETRKLESIRELQLIERKNEGRKPVQNSSRRIPLEFMLRNFDKNRNRSWWIKEPISKLLVRNIPQKKKEKRTEGERERPATQSLSNIRHHQQDPSSHLHNVGAEFIIIKACVDIQIEGEDTVFVCRISAVIVEFSRCRKLISLIRNERGVGIHYSVFPALTSLVNSKEKVAFHIHKDVIFWG